MARERDMFSSSSFGTFPGAANTAPVFFPVVRESLRAYPCSPAWKKPFPAPCYDHRPMKRDS
jgi:hypothetical protein